MTWTNLPESIIANIAIFLVEYRLVACWAYRAEKDSYIEMPSPRCYNGGWKTIVALPSKVMIICPHYLDVFSFPFALAPRSLQSSSCVVLDILRAVSQLCAVTEDAHILFNPGIGGYLMADLYLRGPHLCFSWQDGTGRATSCTLAYNILIQTQEPARLASKRVATNVACCLLALSEPGAGYVTTTNVNHTDGALLFRLFPSGAHLAMASVLFQHGSATARVQAGHGREVDIKILRATEIPLRIPWTLCV